MERLSKNNKKRWLNNAIFLLGTFMVAFAVSTILSPSGLIIGGATGISILVEKVTSIKYTYVLYFVSLGVLVVTGMMLGKQDVMKILVFSIIFPPIIMLIDTFNIELIGKDMFLSAVYFGLIAGTGSGLILKAGFSQGATDTIAKIIHIKATPFIGISQIYLIMDSVIIFLSIFILDRTAAFYGVLAEFVLMKSMDAILIGLSPKKVKLEVISEQSDNVNNYINNVIIRGSTVYDVRGGYTKEQKEKVTTICSTRQAMAIKAYIAEIDPNAFIDVTPVTSVWGEGIGFESIVD